MFPLNAAPSWRRSDELLRFGAFRSRGPRKRRVGDTLYFVSALVGSLAYVLAQPQSTTPAVGASGAISGIIAARLVLFLHVVDSTPTLLLLVLWFATQLFSGVASLTTTTGIAAGLGRVGAAGG